MKSVTLDFEAVAERSLDRVGGTGANQVGWSNLISSSQYRPLFEQLKRSRWSDESQPQKLLDWGAGRGIQMGVAADLGYSVTGVEFYEPELLVGLQREFDGRIDFQKIEDPRRLPFADQTFDVVLSMGVLEHVRETGGSEAASLAEIARVLRPGGTFVCLHFPQKSSWSSFLPGTSSFRFTTTNFVTSRAIFEKSFRPRRHCGWSANGDTAFFPATRLPDYSENEATIKKLPRLSTKWISGLLVYFRLFARITAS